MGKKYAPATLNSSDLLLGIHCICSQSHDIIPLRVRLKTRKNGLSLEGPSMDITYRFLLYQAL
jgi:hypothetical protein